MTVGALCLAVAFAALAGVLCRLGSWAKRAMVVYVDQAMWAWQGLKWCHLLADDLDDLHRFAASLGIKRTSFQAAPKSSVPHYDLTAYERKQAIARGRGPVQPDGNRDHRTPPSV